MISVNKLAIIAERLAIKLAKNEKLVVSNAEPGELEKILRNLEETREEVDSIFNRLHRRDGSQ